MLRSVLFLFLITTFLAFGQVSPTSVFYNGNVYTLSVLPSDIVVQKIDSSLASLNIRKRGDMNYIALYMVDSDGGGAESPLYIKENGRNVYLMTSKAQRDRKLGEAFSFIVPSNIYTHVGGVEKQVRLDNLDRVVVRAFYNNNVYLDNVLNIDVKLVEYLAPKIELLEVVLSESKNVYTITLKYSGGDNKEVSFYYRDGYGSRVYNLIEPLISYGQTNATSIVLKNTFNDGIGKEYIVQVYFDADAATQHLFFNAFDQHGQTTTPPLQVILDAVDLTKPTAMTPTASEPIVVSESEVVEPAIIASVASVIVEQPQTQTSSVSEASVATVATPRAAARPRETTTVAVVETPPVVINVIEDIEEPVINIIDDVSDVDVETVIINNEAEDEVAIESTDEVFIIKNDDVFEKEHLTRQNFIDFPKRIIASIAKESSASLDVVFVIDVTASMQPALDIVKKHVDEIIVEMYNNYDKVRVGFVQFRDIDDDFFVKSSGYMTDRYDIKRFVYSLHAGGGGDLEEPILDAMDSALTDYQFESESRQMFVITDAPSKKSIYTTEKSVMDRIKNRNINLKYFVLPVMK